MNAVLEGTRLYVNYKGFGPDMPVTVQLDDDYTEPHEFKVEDDQGGVWYLPREAVSYSPTLPAESLDKAEFEIAVDKAFADAKAILLERHAKYGPKNISASPYGWKAGLITRLWDKLARLKNMEGDATDESREDAWTDIVGYGVIGLLNERGAWPNA